MGDGEDGSEPTDEPKENVGRRAVERDYVRLCETTRIRRAARTRANTTLPLPPADVENAKLALGCHLLN